MQLIKYSLKQDSMSSVARWIPSLVDLAAARMSGENDPLEQFLNSGAETYAERRKGVISAIAIEEGTASPSFGKDPAKDQQPVSLCQTLLLVLLMLFVPFRTPSVIGACICPYNDHVGGAINSSLRFCKLDIV